MRFLKTLFVRQIILAGAMFLLGHACAVSNADTLDFEDVTLADNSFFDGYGSGASAGSFFSGGAEFNTNQFGPGWSVSNVNDVTTAGFTNQWAAFTGTGSGGSGNYALANSFSPNGAVINFPNASVLFDLQVTNATYPAIAVRDGDAFSKQFGGPTGNDPDFFSVTFTGFSEADALGTETGSVEFFLADFRFADNSQDFILDQWAKVNLGAIGPARSLAVSFDSSDVGQFGLNTPAYVAVDDINFQSVPEPSALVLMAGALCCCLNIRRRS